MTENAPQQWLQNVVTNREGGYVFAGGGYTFTVTNKGGGVPLVTVDTPLKLTTKNHRNHCNHYLEDIGGIGKYIALYRGVQKRGGSGYAVTDAESAP